MSSTPKSTTWRPGVLVILLARVSINHKQLGQLLKELFLVDKYAYEVDTKYPGPPSKDLAGRWRTKV